MKPVGKMGRLAATFGGFAAAGSAASIVLLSAPVNYIGAALAAWLSVASFIDARDFLLLDVLTLPLALAGLVLAYAGYGPGVLSAALGAAIGYLALWGIGALYLRLRGRHGLGLGDAKLLCAAGAWCGALALPMVLLVGSLSALLYIAGLALTGQKIDPNFKLPFGPFLSIGFFCTWFLVVSGSAFVPP